MRKHTSTKIYKQLIIITIFSIFSFMSSCKTVSKDIIDDHGNFLKPDIEADEVFRVLIISDRYESSQMKLHDQLKRSIDKEGDLNISSKLKEYDKINETCEGTLTVWLYPDTGKIMKIRPKALAPIAEINSLIVEDLKRWNFELTGDMIGPNMFDIKYKVVLRKMQSDEEIMKEVMERTKKEEQKNETESAD